MDIDAELFGRAPLRRVDPSVNTRVKPDQIPAALRERPRWLGWHLKANKEHTKPIKLPMSLATGVFPVDAHNPSNWVPFEEAVTAVWTPHTAADGLAFDLIKDDDLVGIDLDHCIDPSGQIADWAKAVMDRLQTYAERSPSGRGIRMFCLGTLPGYGRVFKVPGTSGQIEVYKDRRFLTITGYKIKECPAEPQERTTDLAAWHFEMFGPPPAERPAPAPGAAPTAYPDLEDGVLLEKARAAKNGKKFTELWDGGGAKGDRSAGDLALCNMLAFWTGKNAEQMDRLVRCSKRMRDKWDERHFSDGTTHGEHTIAKAIEFCREVYSPPTPDGRAQIEANIGDLRDATTVAWDVLVEANDPPTTFTLGSDLVQLEHSELGRPVTYVMTKERLRHRMAEVARYVTLVKDETAPKDDGPAPKIAVPARPPLDVMVNMLAGRFGPVPELTRIVYGPIYTADGALLATRGYHPESGVYCALPPDFTLPDIPARPTAAQIKQARDLLYQLVSTFPFAGDADRAHALALVVGLLARELVPGQLPVLLVDKPKPRTGASLLVGGLLQLGLGYRVKAWAMPVGEEEMEKRLTTILREAPSAVWFDNVAMTANSPMLAMAITQDPFANRKLGGNESVTLRTRVAWIVTANNVRTSDELKGRAVLCRLDAQMEHPETRPFLLQDDKWNAEIERTYPQLLAAAATWVQAWLAAGRPESTAQGPGGFSGWSRVVGGILQVAGIEGFLQNQADLRERVDETTAALHVLVRRWWQRFPKGAKVTSSPDLWEAIMLHSDAPLLDLTAPTEHGRRVQFGLLVATLKDQVFTLEDGQVVVVRWAGRNRDGSQLWTLEPRW